MGTIWTTEWPTQEGLYWFYGYRFCYREQPPNLWLVRVRTGNNCVVYASEGAFIFIQEAEGVWAPVIIPDVPQFPPVIQTRESFCITRLYSNEEIPSRVVKWGLTEAEAKAHCKDPETSSTTCKLPANIAHTEKYGHWFDGFDEDSCSLV